MALGELAQPGTATVRQRRVLMAGSVVAANLPDIDLAYSWITPAPLGYLLHHRGHTHTLAGLVVLGFLLAMCFRLWPAARELTGRGRARLWGLMAFNLVGHVSLDAFNNYSRGGTNCRSGSSDTSRGATTFVGQSRQCEI